MKKLFNVFILSTLCVFLASCASSRIPSDFSGITCGQPTYEYLEDGTVNISFYVEVPANYFDKHITFCLMPSLKYANDKVEKLPCKTVQGSGVIDTNYPVVDWSVDQKICYKTNVKFHEGLATATLQTEAWIFNCLSKEEMVAPLCSWEFIVKLPPVLPQMKQHVVTESARRAALIGKVYFPVNAYTVTASVSSQEDITRMVKSLRQLISRDDFTISTIEIVGNASPEGTSKINDPLAQKRANNTRSFFEKALKDNGYKKDVPADAWTVTSTSGNGFWNEFYTAIKESNLSNKDELASKFLKLSNDPAEAEKQIRYEIATNKEVKAVMMPSLRFGAITVHFQPINLSAEEIQMIAVNQPEYLTPNDIIGAAEALPTQESINLYTRSLERYPDAVELYVNLAGKYITTGDLDNAQKVLNDAAIVADTQEEQDMIALQRAAIYMQQGNSAKAQEALSSVKSDKDRNYYQGIICLMNDENEKAEDLLAPAKDVNYAIALLNQNKVKKALNVLEGLDQNDAHVLYYTGICYGRLNEPVKAAEYKAKSGLE